MGRAVPQGCRNGGATLEELAARMQKTEKRVPAGIEEPDEGRRLHTGMDETLLRGLRNNLEDRFATASELFRGNGQAHEEGNGRADWLKLLGKWDDTLSNALRLEPQKGTFANDLDAETERLYADHVAAESGVARARAREPHH